MAIESLTAAAVPTPVALLRDLNLWMEAAQHGADHPWRIAISETLAANGADDAQAGAAAGLPVALAQSALLEITNLSILMRRLIPEHDRGGVLEPLTRGMLKRVQVLSEAVSDCIERNDESPAIEAVARTIGCLASGIGQAMALEVRHG